MPKYIAKGRINHNNKLYESGDEIEMSEKQAKPLLERKLLIKTKNKEKNGAGNAPNASEKDKSAQE